MKETLVEGRSASTRSPVAPFFTVSAKPMAPGHRALCVVWLSLIVLLPSVARGGVQALFNVDVVGQAPFPSDRFTAPNPENITRLQVNLPLPDCKWRPSDCNDLGVINTLDGFNVNARLSIPFSGPIDVNTATSDTVFLVNLGKSRHHGKSHYHDDRETRVVGINQVVWDPAANTLHAKPDQLLEQDTPYALIVTDGVHDTASSPVQPSAAFAELLNEDFDTSQPYLVELSEALDDFSQGDSREELANHIVVASVFTTQSVSAILEKIQRQIAVTTPAPASFLLGPGGSRTGFPLDDITRITVNAQTGTRPSFTTLNFPFLDALKVIPNVVGRVAFGKYSSPDYEVHPGEFIPAVGTLTGVPIVQRTNDVHFILVLPSGSKPESGWPVAIFGHGSTTIADFVAFIVAAKMAQHGIATICIQAVGHGFGPLSTVTVTQSGGGTVTFPWGGRGIDQDGDGDIKFNEGAAAAPPRTIIGLNDGSRQTVVDLLQLVRVIQAGMDVDGDGSSALDLSRIYYFGQSFGGVYGTVFMGIEPYVLVGVLNAAGGPGIDSNRLSPFGRAGLRASLGARVPSLLNISGGMDFNENLPLRNQLTLINTVPGADAIQELFDRVEWAVQRGSPVAYARYVREDPLEGVPEKLTIFQNSKGDEQIPNPTSTALIQAGALADVETFYRNELAVAADPLVPKTPHAFLLQVLSSDPLTKAIALDAQEQIATFFDSDGGTIINPNPKFFEVPIVPPLPETCNYLFPLPPGFFPNC
jgi:hypothetical protein